MAFFFCQVSILIRADKNQCIFVSTQRNLEPESAAATITQRSIVGPDPFLLDHELACRRARQILPKKYAVKSHPHDASSRPITRLSNVQTKKKKRKGCTSINKHGSIVQYNFRVRSNDWLRQAGCETRAAKAWA